MEKTLSQPAVSSPAMPEVSSGSRTSSTAFHVIAGISVSHMLNDMMQSVLLAIYPMLKLGMSLSFAQIGLITLTYQVTASLLQPLVGWHSDKHPKPYSLSAGMCFTFTGLVLLSQATTFPIVLLAASLVGMGSSIFHPESSRVARLASGGRYGLAQSLFQVGGNLGSALGPLLAALIIVPHGQGSVAWFAVAALAGALILLQVGHWYKRHRSNLAAQRKPRAESPFSRPVIVRSIAVLLVLIFSKYFYMTSLSSYYTFYLMHRFNLSMKSAQIYLFTYLFAVAAGTVLGGPIGDRIGRKRVIWGSILGAAPFTLLMPYADLFWTGILSVIIGLVMASAFSAILVYAQELVPGRVGTISGLFFGFAFGIGGVGAALLGNVADATNIEFVYRVCAWLPLLGLLTVFLPEGRKTSAH